MVEQTEQDLIRAELESFRDLDGDIGEYDLGEDWECVEEGEWLQEHKRQKCEMIVKHTASGRHFSVLRDRSGYYHAGWDFDAVDIREVKLVTETVVVTKWVAV